VQGINSHQSILSKEIDMYWISVKVRVRFVNKSQAVVTVKNRLSVFDNHFPTFNRFIDTTFEKNRVVLRQRTLLHQFYLYKSGMNFCTDLILPRSRRSR